MTPSITEWLLSMGIQIRTQTDIENEKIVERLKLKIGQYHGKTNYEDYDELLQSILGGESE